MFHARPEFGNGFVAKVGKEEMVGIYTAVKHLIERDEREVIARYKQQMDYIFAQLDRIPGFTLISEGHGVWADHFSVQIWVDSSITCLAEGELYRACAEGSPYIEVGLSGTGVLLCASTLKAGEERIVVSRLLEAIQKANS